MLACAATMPEVQDILPPEVHGADRHGLTTLLTRVDIQGHTHPCLETDTGSSWPLHPVMPRCGADIAAEDSGTIMHFGRPWCRSQTSAGDEQCGFSNTSAANRNAPPKKPFVFLRMRLNI